MNLPVCAILHDVENKRAGYPQGCGKDMGFLHDFNMVIHTQKALYVLAFWALIPLFHRTTTPSAESYILLLLHGG